MISAFASRLRLDPVEGGADGPVDEEILVLRPDVVRTSTLVELAHLALRERDARSRDPGEETSIVVLHSGNAMDRLLGIGLWARQSARHLDPVVGGTMFPMFRWIGRQYPVDGGSERSRDLEDGIEMWLVPARILDRIQSSPGSPEGVRPPDAFLAADASSAEVGLDPLDPRGTFPDGYGAELDAMNGEIASRMPPLLGKLMEEGRPGVTDTGPSPHPEWRSPRAMEFLVPGSDGICVAVSPRSLSDDDLHDYLAVVEDHMGRGLRPATKTSGPEMLAFAMRDDRCVPLRTGFVHAADWEGPDGDVVPAIETLMVPGGVHERTGLGVHEAIHRTGPKGTWRLSPLDLEPCERGVG